VDEQKRRTRPAGAGENLDAVQIDTMLVSAGEQVAHGGLLCQRLSVSRRRSDLNRGVNAHDSSIVLFSAMIRIGRESPVSIRGKPDET
jgi:hypothetical protein